MPAMTPTGAPVEEFLDAVSDEQRRADAYAVSALMADVSGEPPVMWGSSIVGFGTYHYRYASGREGDAPLVGFSPRKPHLVLYLAGEFETKNAETLARLGPHSVGKGCLYLKRLTGVD